MKSKPESEKETFPDSKTLRKECIKLLTRREHSRKQLQDKLSHKGFERGQISEVIDELSVQNWQNDNRYAENYVRFRYQKGFGPVRIAFELRQQGIDAETTDKALQSQSDSWFDSLEKVYFKKFPAGTGFDLVERGKRTRFLLQRGFPNDMVNALLSRQSQKST